MTKEYNKEEVNRWAYSLEGITIFCQLLVLTYSCLKLRGWRQIEREMWKMEHASKKLCPLL